MKIGNIEISSLKVGSADCKVYLGSLQVYPHSYYNDYLTFEALEDGTFMFSGVSDNSLSYSLANGSTWTSLASETNTPTVHSGHTILWKGSNLAVSTTDGIGRFSSTNNFNVKGNVKSLFLGDNFNQDADLSTYGGLYRNLFKNNTKLISAENMKFPSMYLPKGMCAAMFQGCTSLTTAPELPATTLTTNCYQSMFDGCTSLTVVPELPATTLAQGCYATMFQGCTNLVKAQSILPSMDFADYKYCYQQMFKGCTRLSVAPVLPATKLGFQSYYGMFYECFNLQHIKCLATDITASNCTTNWLYGVAPSGTFTKNPSMNSWTSGANGVPSGWTSVTYEDYFRFVAKGNGTFRLSGSSIDYSLDSGSTWTTLPSNTNTPTVQSGHTILWKSTHETTNNSIGTFSSTTLFDVEGNTMSLVYGDDFQDKLSLEGRNKVFWSLFQGCTYVQNADRMELPATTLSTSCYTNMFNRASALSKAPTRLPAITLTEGCYYNMFYMAINISTLHIDTSFTLPAPTLVKDCYRQMFRNNASVNRITCLATSGIDTDGSTSNWLEGTSSSGTFIRANSSVVWPNTVSGYHGWTLQNYS